MAIPTWKMFPALALRKRVRLQAGRGRAAHRARCSSRSCSRRVCRPRSSSSCTALGEDVGAAIVEHPGRAGRSRSPARPRPGASSARRAAACTSGCRSRWAARTRRSCMDDADLDLALEGVLWGAFGTTGQRCTATSRLILQDGDPRRVPRRSSCERARALKLGDGRKKGTDVGPLIHEAARAEGRALRRHRAERGRRPARAAAGGRTGRRLEGRLLLRADDLRARRGRDRGSSRRRSSGRCSR